LDKAVTGSKNILWLSKAPSVTVGLLFLAVLVWLIVNIIKPDPFPAGTSMPLIEYSTDRGLSRLKPETASKTIVVFFHRRCKSCIYEFQQIESHLSAFGDTKFVFITSDRFLLHSKFKERWPVLSSAENVEWGIADRNEFRSAFGSLVTPALFFFDEQGILYHKMQGEVRLERVIEALSLRYTN
jgi:hypothetical protein